MYSVLIVDDEKMIRNGMKKVLPWEKMGVNEVFTAASGPEAIKIIKEQKPEIMITDINMTEMTGIELIELAREIVPNLRIIVLTGHDSFEYARCCLRLNVEDFFLKPIDEDDLAKAIKNQVNYLDNTKIEEKKLSFLWRVKGISEQSKLEKCMRSIVHKRYKDDSFLEELYSHYHFNKEQPMQLAFLIPRLKMENSEQENLFYTTSIKNICMSMIDLKGDGITFTDDIGMIAIIFFLYDSNVDIVEKIEQITNILIDEFEEKPKVVLGSEANGFENLDISYNDAVFLLENEKEGFREILQANTAQNRVDIFSDIYAELRNRMYVNAGNPEYILKAFDIFCKACESYSLSVVNIRRFCFEIAASVYFAYTINATETKDGKLNALSESLIFAKKEDACEVTQMFLEQLLKNDEGNRDEIISKAKNYINIYLTQDLSVSNIAESLYVTPNYFSRLFKRVTGEGCNEYIVRKRIEKAKSLLETTTIRTGKIATMVGYRDTNYFSLAFKKYEGISPTKYRENIRKMDSIL
jgi:two-component system, response regulator YesN